MKNKMLEPKTDTPPSQSPYQAERAEAQETAVVRPGPLGATLAPPGSEATVRAHAAGLNRATAGRTLRRLQRQYGNRYVQRVVELAQHRGSGEGFTLDDETAGRINRARGGGRQLDGVVQTQMSEALGHDFSGVRVHTDSEAHTLNRLLSARAFTTGHDIFFRRGEYNPGSSRGQELIAHELTHVLQQSSGRVSRSGRGTTVRPAGDVFEQEAENEAEASERGKRVGRQTDVLALQRTVGNRAVQRVTQAAGLPNTAITSAGFQISWQDPPEAAMNCHGHTYGTYARWHRNPSQDDAGVGQIVADEAGPPIITDMAPTTFLALGPHHVIRVGNLITVAFGGIQWTHSMRVVQIGPNIDNVIVSNVQGYGGAVQIIPVTQVPQVRNQGSLITVYPRTPRSF